MRLTIACPEALRDDANQLAMVLGYGPSDALTYGELNWQDAGGNLYACASLPVSDTFTTAAQSGRRHTRYRGVTGVQTCALPIWTRGATFTPAQA